MHLGGHGLRQRLRGPFNRQRAALEERAIALRLVDIKSAKAMGSEEACMAQRVVHAP